MHTDINNTNLENNNLISNNIENNIQFLKNRFTNCSDVVYKEMKISNTRLYVIYINGLIDKTLLMEQLLEKLFLCKHLISDEESSIMNIANQIPITETSTVKDLNTAASKIMNGNVLLFIENNNTALLVSIKKYSSTEKPSIEPTILGPKESFTKALENNTALVRKYLNNEDCKILNIELGNAFKKQCSIMYLKSVTNKKILDEVFKRLNSIDLDILMDVSNLAELIEDNPYSPFPTVTITERIDKVAASMLEGQIVLLLDNSPFAIILPSVFIGFFNSPEDYYNRFYLSSFLRMLRFISYFISIYLPGFYIATTIFNQELIPTKLLVSIATQTSHTPFSSTVELILMLFAFELLRELGIRLPKQIGSTVSLVGALIIGETVVRAGLVSTPVVIITAFTAITSMLLPSIQLYESILVCRIITLLLSSTLGFWGIIISLLLSSSHLCTLSSFGVPYVYSMISNNTKNINDIVARAPLWPKNRMTLFKRKNKF